MKTIKRNTQRRSTRRITRKKTYVVDTSIIIERKVSELISQRKISGKIIIPYAVLAELEHQANTNQAEGFIGLEEIKELRNLAAKRKISLDYAGEKPKEWHIKGARSGTMDNLIRETAQKYKATLITADRVQALVAEALGIPVILSLPVPIKEVQELDIEQFFDEDTMSIHLKENTLPLAKRGKPGNWRFETLKPIPLTAHEIKTFAADVVEKTQMADNAFIEVANPGIKIIQFKNYRIVICKPPFSDGWELTAVRPLVSLDLNYYKLSKKLISRLESSASGILISGAPGSGKTTFASALAKFYLEKGKIIKTIESPRDLQVPDEVVQYSKNLGKRDDIHNVLLLTRPDYTFFDEMRTADDFRLYSDLRLAGIGLAGVVHATNPIDAVQRFINKVELGMIPQIIDTVIFIKDGEVNKVLELVMKVKVPTGMTEADLARPVVEVRDFETGELEYEIYTYGEQTVVVPIKQRLREKIFTTIPFRVKESKKFVSFYLTKQAKSVNLYINGEPITSMSVGRRGLVKIYKKSKLGKQVMAALASGEEISFSR